MECWTPLSNVHLGDTPHLWSKYLIVPREQDSCNPISTRTLDENRRDTVRAVQTKKNRWLANMGSRKMQLSHIAACVSPKH